MKPIVRPRNSESIRAWSTGTHGPCAPYIVPGKLANAAGCAYRAAGGEAPVLRLLRLKESGAWRITVYDIDALILT